MRSPIRLACLFLIACADPSTPVPTAAASPEIVCTGRIEPYDGEVEVSAQMPGTLVSLHVREGEWVEKGALLATLDARPQAAAVALAEARLARLTAGHGKEEIAAVDHQRQALEADLHFARRELERGTQLRASTSLAEGELEARQGRVDALSQQILGLAQQVAAMRRGPLPEEIAVAKAELQAARTDHELRFVRAESAGTILHLYRHVGDYVSSTWPTPILRMGDTRRLRLRIEVGETEVGKLQVGMKGSFTVFGVPEVLGEATVATILPSFAPKRLFDPDGAARVDTRVLQALCEVTTGGQVFSGQRVVVRLPCR